MHTNRHRVWTNEYFRKYLISCVRERSKFIVGRILFAVSCGGVKMMSFSGSLNRIIVTHARARARALIVAFTHVLQVTLCELYLRVLFVYTDILCTKESICKFNPHITSYLSVRFFLTCVVSFFYSLWLLISIINGRKVV